MHMVVPLTPLLPTVLPIVSEHITTTAVTTDDHQVMVVVLTAGGFYFVMDRYYADSVNSLVLPTVVVAVLATFVASMFFEVFGMGTTSNSPLSLLSNRPPFPSCGHLPPHSHLTCY